jgi:nondiscriminating aspartyl-tRNA synthetase
MSTRQHSDTRALTRTLIVELRRHVGNTVKVQGFVQSIRDQKTMQFLILRDQTGLVQAALERTSGNTELNNLVSGLTRDSIVDIIGQVIKEPRVRLGGLEIRLVQLNVVAAAPEILPIDLTGKTQPSLENRLNWRFLDLRRPEAFLIFKIQTTAEMAMRDYWMSQGFIEIHSPKLMATASESGAEVFEVKYFDRTAYLAQSPQFYKQMAMAAGFDRVFEIGPAFRAEPSFTARHSTEITSVDIEISWIESHQDVMEFEELWLQHVIERVKEAHGEEIKKTFGAELKVPSVPFPRVTMREAKAIVAEGGIMIPEEEDLGRDGEISLAEYMSRETGHEFVFVKDYPVQVRPFYHMREEHDPNVTRSYDLLWKGLEITTGAQREHRYEKLVAQVIEKGLSLASLEHYLSFFKYGCPPHGGFGFGLSRMLMAMLGLSNVREVTFIPRDPTRLHP